MLPVDMLIGMPDVSWVPEAASALIALGALAYAITADRRSARAHKLAERADKRAERAEQLERVRLELVRDPREPSVFAFVNRGTDTVEWLEIDPASVTSVAFHGNLSVSELHPSERSYPFQLGEHGVKPRLPGPIRVTWAHPFEGQQYVSLPDDPDEAWSYTIYG